MSGPHDRRAPVKVVIINTHFVETDARGFKSVVQELTGKESTEADVVASASRNRLSGRDQKVKLMRDVSFKELERLISDMPPVDELYRLWAD